MHSKQLYDFLFDDDAYDDLLEGCAIEREDDSDIKQFLVAYVEAADDVYQSVKNDL